MVIKNSASALYRPTIIQSEEDEKREAAEQAKEGNASSPNPMDFSIFKDITFLLFFISQGKIILFEDKPSSIRRSVFITNLRGALLYKIIRYVLCYD